VDVVDRLIACIKAKGSGAVIDIADVGQRESFDVIGKCSFCLSPPSLLANLSDGMRAGRHTGLMMIDWLSCVQAW
jgi:hypothetical protein